MSIELEGKGRHQKLWYGWEDSFKIYIRGMGYEVLGWIQLGRSKTK